MSWIFGRSKEDKSNEENEQLVMAKSINKQITKENIELKEKLKNVESEFNSIKVKYEELKNKLENKEELKYYEDKNIEKYYDIVININSLKGIKNGWDIKWTDENSKNYENLKNNDYLRVGVIGNGNKGKSFILQKFSGNELPKGTSIKTEGLSLLYPKQGKMNNIVLLDSAGFETPLLNSHFQDKTEKTKIDDNTISEIAKDKIFTELFLQRLIIDFSDALLIVVGILTFSEQKLLNRIKKSLMDRNRRHQSIFVIHNLQSFVEVKQVEDYIKDILLNSATFSIKQIEVAGFGESHIKRNMYIEKYGKDLTLNHIIMANEGSNAGNYYNNYTIKSLTNSICSLTNRENVDIINEIKNNFIRFSQEVLETYTKDNSNFKSLSEGDVIFNEKENKIILNSEIEIKFKKLLVDELGISNFRNNNCEPKYSYYKSRKDKQCFLVIKVELPGKFTNLKGSCYDDENGYSIFEILGEKLKDDEDANNSIIRDMREYGKFAIILPLKASEIHFLNTEATVSDTSDKGIVTFSFEILDNKKNHN